MPTLRNNLLLPNAETIVLKDMNIKRAYLEFQLSTAVNTAFPVTNIINLERVNITVNMKNGGTRETWASNGLAMLPSMISRSNFGSDHLRGLGVLLQTQTATLSAKSVMRVPVLPLPVNLSGDDVANVTFNMPTNTELFALGVTGTCNFVVEDGIVNEDSVYTYETINIDPARPNQTIQLGDGVCGIYLVSRQTTYQYDNTPFNTVQLESSKAKVTKSKEMLLIDNIKGTIGLASAGFMPALYEGVPTNECTLSYNCNAATLVAGNQYLLIIRSVLDDLVYYRQRNRENRRVSKLQRKLSN